MWRLASLRIATRKKRKFERFSRGELHQAHGEEEAEDWIRRGKFVAVVDSDGDEMFVKKKVSESFSAVKAKATSVSRCNCTSFF